METKENGVWSKTNSSDKNRKRYHRENRRGSIRAGKVKETDKVRYLGIVINSEGNLKDHMRQIETKTSNISKERVKR